MNLTTRVDELVRACFAGIWIESHEHADAIAELTALCQREQWRLATWDIDQGLGHSGENPIEANDPLTAVKSLTSLATDDAPTLLVLQNFHRFLASVEIVQAIAHAVIEGKQRRCFVPKQAPRSILAPSRIN